MKKNIANRLPPISVKTLSHKNKIVREYILYVLIVNNEGIIQMVDDGPHESGGYFTHIFTS